jgi:class I fructose-bisphosphate aldolase/fructose-bisphosphate aldolase/2-amino-3,7-dideoxy-D-threo-hept-6-ulosonate synthase
VGAGKERRMRRLFREDGRTLMVALDHALVTGRGPGYAREVAAVAAARPDAVLVTWHMARSGAGLFAQSGLVLRLDGGMTDLGAGQAGDASATLYSVEDALAMGADAVIVLAYPGRHDEHHSLRRLAALCARCEQFGLPVVAEAIPGGWGQEIPWTVESVARAARITAELGADVVKTVCPGDPSEFAAVVEACPVPVVALGGPRADSEDAVIELARGVVRAGAAGIAFGRNVWGAADPGATVRRLEEAVHCGTGAAAGNDHG